MEQGRGSPDEMHVPLRLLLPSYGGGNEYSDGRQLAVYNPPPPQPPPPPPKWQPAFGGSRFKLPEGWEVEEVPRADASRVDKVLFEFDYFPTNLSSLIMCICVTIQLQQLNLICFLVIHKFG